MRQLMRVFKTRKSSFRRKAWTIFRAIAVLLMVLLFQNCGQPFETSQDFSSLQNSSGTAETPPETGGAPQVVNPPASAPPTNPPVTSAPPVVTACSVENGTGRLNAQGQCEAMSCNAFYKLENKFCVLESENRACTISGRKGTQGFVSGAWNVCKTCDDGYTSFKGACHENPALIRRYASILPGCWQDRAITCAVGPFAMFIGPPTQYSITSKGTTSFGVTYTGASSVQLTESHIILSGPGAAGCKKTVTGSGLFARTVSISNCSGVGPLKLSVAAGSATSTTGVSAPSATSNAEVVVANVESMTHLAILETTVSYPGAQGNMIPFEYYYPADYASRRNIPIIIWIHGGGWSHGTAVEDRPWARVLADLGFIVLNINYTLAPPSPVALPNVSLPATPYVAGPNDVQAFLQYVKQNAHILNGDLSNVSIAGVSAGGHLALHQATRPDNTFQFRCVINVSGPSDLAIALDGVNYPVSKAIVRNVMGDGVPFLQSSSPAYNMRTFKGARLGLFHQLTDNLTPVEQTLGFVTKVKEVQPHLETNVIYGQDLNPYPWINPRADQLSHSFDVAPTLNALKAYVYSYCR